MIIGVKEVQYINDYKLLVAFDNGVKKVVDLKDHIYGEVFQPLKNIEYFKTVKVNQDTDTISWENRADFSPEFLYEIGEEYRILI